MKKQQNIQITRAKNIILNDIFLFCFKALILYGYSVDVIHETVFKSLNKGVFQRLA